MSSVLFSKKVFQEVQPMGGVGCRPSGSASLPERKKRKVVARTSICAKLVLLVVLWNTLHLFSVRTTFRLLNKETRLPLKVPPLKSDEDPA